MRVVDHPIADHGHRDTGMVRGIGGAVRTRA